MNNEQGTTKSNGRLSLILNDDYPTTNTSGQESLQKSKEVTTTTNGSGKAPPKIKKEFKYPQPPKETSSSKNDGTTTSKTTSKPAAKNSKQAKQTKAATSAATAAAPSKVKPSANSRKRPLSPSDSEGGRETSQEPERCLHPKHDEYMIPSDNKRAKLDKPPKLVGMPRRLEGVLNIDRGTKMCSRCISQTDKDPQYVSHKKYVSRKSVYKKNERSRLKIDMNGE